MLEQGLFGNVRASPAPRPLRYAGGKSRAVSRLMSLFPRELPELVSPFFGGGSVEIACAQLMGTRVFGSDVFGLLTNYWQQQIARPTELADLLADWRPDEYYARKETLRAHYYGEQIVDDDLLLAALYWFNHNLSYGPGFLGWQSEIYKETSNYINAVARVRRFDGTGIEMKCASFEDVLPTDKFVFADPPYVLGDDSSVFAGMYPSRNISVFHNGFNHLLLRELLADTTAGGVVSF